MQEAQLSPVCAAPRKPGSTFVGYGWQWRGKPSRLCAAVGCAQTT